MENEFVLDKRLEHDSLFIKSLPFCDLRLMRDELDWLLLIPRVNNLSELTDLNEEESLSFFKDLRFVTTLLKKNIVFDKMNIALIGNIVSQLHTHIILRHKTDRAWPNTIWGSSSLLKFDESRLQFFKDLFK